MFFLKLFLVALAANTFNLISAEDTTAQKIGWTGTLSSLDGGLMGTVVVVDATTIMINNYQLLDASAPALHWWGSTDGMLKDGFRVSQTQVTQKSTSNTLTINLDAGKTTADFTTFGLWCESFKANFGQTTLAAATTGGSAGSSTSGSTSSSATSASPTTSAKTGGGDGLSVGHSVSLAGFAALSTSTSTSASGSSSSAATSAKTGGAIGVRVGQSVALVGFAALLVVDVL